MKTLVLPLILLAAPAMAGTFTPPQGCKTYLTVQAHGCLVSQMYTCEADPAGDQWRADFSADGPVFLSKIDAETQWIESYEINPPTRETLDPNPKDPASFTELMATGLDTFDFGLTKSDGSHTNVKGYDMLTGHSATIDGVVLQQTEYEYSQTDDEGNVLRHSKGNEYVSTEWRTFLSGKSQWEEADGTWLPSDNTPVKFYRPGDAGFQQTVPLFDCNAESAGLSLPGLPAAPAPLPISLKH
jgi:hypothetical protein